MTDNQSPESESSPESTLSDSLGPVQYLRQIWLAGVHVGVFVGIFVACALVFIGLDYLLPLPWWVRAGLLVGSVGLALWIVQQIYGGPLAISYTTLASKLETIFPQFKDRLVTAVEVAEGRTEPPDSLRDYILRRGADAAKQVKSWSVLNREYPVRTGLIFLLPLLLLFVGSIAYPTVMVRHGARFILPGARVPPVTDTRLHLPDKTEVIRGEDATINLKVSGSIPDRAQLYVTYPDGEWNRRAMQAVGREDGYFQFRSVIGRPDHSFEYYVTAGDATSFSHRVDVLIPPTLQSPVVKLDPPAYSGEPVRQFEAGPVRALRGSTVTVRTGVEPPGSKVSINVVDSATRTVSMRPEGDTLTGRWTVRGKGHWLMLPVSPDGVAPELDKWPIRTIPDHPPQIDVNYPPEDHEVSAVSEVPIELQASDDYGLRSIRLKVGRDSEPATTFVRKTFSKPYPTSTELSFDIPLEQYDLQPGDFVSYRVEARDGNTVSGPGIKTSSPRFLEVVPFDTYRLRASASGDTFSEQQMREVILKLERIVGAQKDVFRRTGTQLAEGRDPSGTAFRRVRGHQLNVRDASDSLVRAIDQFIQQDEVKFPEDEYLALRNAIDQMEFSAEELGDRNRETSLGHQRQAINLLNRQLQWLRAIYRRSQSQQQGAGQVSDEEFTPSDTLPEAPSGQTEMREYSEEVRQLMEQAEGLLEQYSTKEEMEDSLSEMGPAGLQRLRDLLKNVGSLSPEERAELARMAGEMNLTDDPELLADALEKLARAGEARATLRALWNGRMDEALKRMERAGLSDDEREQIVAVFQHLKPCRITDSCDYGPEERWEELQQRINRTMSQGDGPLPDVDDGERGDSLARLMEQLQGGRMDDNRRGRLGRLAEEMGYVEDGEQFTDTLEQLADTGVLRDTLTDIEQGNLDEARSRLRGSGMSEPRLSRTIQALNRLSRLRELDRAGDRLSGREFQEYADLARNADRLDTEGLRRLADLARRGGMCAGDNCLEALQQLRQSGQMGRVIRQLARGQFDEARETMEEADMSEAQQQTAINMLGPANGAQGQGLADTMRARIQQAVSGDTGQQGRQLQGAGSVVERIRNVRRELRILHQLLQDRKNRSGEALALSEKEEVPEELRELVRDYFRRLNEQ